MSEIEEVVQNTIENAAEWPLNSLVAVLVAVTATLMAIGNIKDGNIVQAMARAQAKAVDTWSYYQSKSVKQHVKENALDQVRLRLETETGLSDSTRHQLESIASRYAAEVERYEKEKKEIKQEAERYERSYDQLNVHDDQFDMAEAFFSVAIALYGITALTRKKFLLSIAVAFSGLGALLTIAGFAELNLRFEWLARLLG
jgi:uncharacterized protein YejL (UPF0352 family)